MTKNTIKTKLLRWRLGFFILDLFFPKRCIVCGKYKTYFCESCFSKIKLIETSKCPICERPIPYGSICKICQKKTYLNHLFWATDYRNPVIKKLIKTFKYRSIKELANPLSKLLIENLKKISNILNISSSIIVPISLHKKKLRERGYNQSELLAKQVADYYKYQLEPEILKRKTYTLSQSQIKNHQIRKENLKNAFEIDPKFIKKCQKQNKNLLKNKIIILIDDVFTTGATLSEAAKILKRAGAKEIWGLVVAKG